MYLVLIARMIVFKNVKKAYTYSSEPLTYIVARVDSVHVTNNIMALWGFRAYIDG